MSIPPPLPSIFPLLRLELLHTIAVAHVAGEEVQGFPGDCRQSAGLSAPLSPCASQVGLLVYSPYSVVPDQD